MKMSEFPEFTELTEEQAKQYMVGREGQRVRKVIAKHVRNMGGSVLDIGCGRGIDAYLYNNNTYLGIDVSPSLIEVAKEQNQYAKFKVVDAQKIPFKDNTWDNVICKSFFEHLHSEEQVVQCLKEAIRVCKRQLLIAWHTPPGYHTTQIIKLQGNFGRKIYQNRYNTQAIMTAVPKKIKKKSEIVDGFWLWRFLM